MIRKRISPAPSARDFATDEAGTMSVFSVSVFALMLMTAGIAIDALRHEEERAELQGALDRGVLAASSLAQTRDPEVVVLDYVEAAGFTKDDVEITVIEKGPANDLTSREVTARTTRDIDTLFLPLLGIDDLSVPGRARAEDEVTRVEIAFVVDVSGSMGRNNRLQNLKSASNTFIELLADNDTIDLTMSIIPYHAMVNVGDALDGPFNLDGSHAFSSCGRFGTNASYYTRTDLPGPSDPNSILRTEIERVGHFDMQSYSGTTPGDLPNPACDTDNSRAILGWTNDEAALKGRIDSLYADGWTAIHLGLKWGSLMLDPWSRDIVSDLITDGVVSDDHAGRPYDYGTDGTQKFLVLMTDGSNNREVDMQSTWKNDAMSNAYVHHTVWPNTGFSTDYDGGDNFGRDGTPEYSFYVPYRANAGLDAYWDPATKDWRADPVGGTAAQELSFKQLYARFPSGYIAGDMLYTPSVQQTGSYWNGSSWQSYTYWTNNSPKWSFRRTYWYPDEALFSDVTDTYYANICAAMKTAGVTIFTVGFEAPTATAGILENCASSSAHYYTAVGEELEDRFANIAHSITRLSLRQ